MIGKKKRNKIAAVFLIAASVLLLGKISFDRYEKGKTITIGVITDIHAGSQDTRVEITSTNGIPNIIHPSNFETNFKKALEGMKKTNLIIALGDNVNIDSSNTKYSKALKELASSYPPIIWVKGNHDSDESFAVLSSKNYYYKDIGKWRIIVLDNGHLYAPGPNNPHNNLWGYMDDQQISWLKEALKTDKKILIAMHVPIFNAADINQVQPEQEWLKKLFEDSGNVKYVLAGHFHVYNWHKEINGINYYVVPSISLEGGEGYFMKLELK